MVREFFFGLFRFGSTSGCRHYSALTGALMLAAFFCFNGCSKAKPPTAQTTPPVADTNPAAAVMPGAPVSTPPPVEIAANPDGSVDLKALNHAYIGWIVQTRRAPKSFEDYVSMSGAKVPPPPPGKKYVIDRNGFINFANN
jgi:hypothetical protein